MYSKRERSELMNSADSCTRAATPSAITQVDDGRRVDEPVGFIDHAHVVDRNPLMLETTVASVNMSADYEPRPHSLDRVEQLAASNMLDAAGVQVERAVPVVQRRLMRHQNVGAFRNRSVDGLELTR